MRRGWSESGSGGCVEGQGPGSELTPWEKGKKKHSERSEEKLHFNPG